MRARNTVTTRAVAGLRGTALALGLVVAATPAPLHAQVATADETAVIRLKRVRTSLFALAHDSMEGRRTGTAGIARAARYIAAEMERIGLEPAGDDGYFQTVPLARTVRPDGRPAFQVLFTDAMRDTVPADRRVDDRNVVGLIRGGDPSLRDEVVVVGAHHDHVGIGPPVDGDSIYNGADDDASGVVAVLEIARALKAGPAPRRTVVFIAFTGEEMGLLGTRWYLANPTYPLDAMVAQFQIEMTGRPDSLAGGPGKAWLTGYERSTMGDMLRDHGIPIVPDPRPEQNFFMRSDNIAFARAGIPAHTLSSFNLHTDYHRPSDTADRVDYEHMTEVIRAAARAVASWRTAPCPSGTRAGGRSRAEGAEGVAMATPVAGTPWGSAFIVRVLRRPDLLEERIIRL
jgi:hypothetical protein